MTASALIHGMFYYIQLYSYIHTVIQLLIEVSMPDLIASYVVYEVDLVS